MKTTPLAWMFGCLITAVALGADRPCVVSREFWPPPNSCRVTNHWSKSVDLTGDGTAEFLHDRLRIEKYYSYYSPDYSSEYIENDDIEAFYPEPHVDLYLRVYVSDGYPEHMNVTEARLRHGAEIAPDPGPIVPQSFTSGWYWFIPPYDQLRFAAEGLGIIIRYQSWYPCEFNCRGYSYAGWLYDTKRPLELVQEHLFGFRVAQADGHHLGWLRLRGTGAWPQSTAELVDYVVHPDPEQPLNAGEPARPALYTRREGDQITITWREVWAGWRLERRREAGKGVWEPVPDVPANTYTIPAAEGSWLFRLVK